MRTFLKYFTRVSITILAFAAGFKATDWFFRREIIPYPFEFFGVLTGLAFASWIQVILNSFPSLRRRGWGG